MLVNVFTDGGARGNPGIAGYGLVVTNDGQILYQEYKFLGIKTNNQAEYSGLIAALTWLVNNKDTHQITEVHFNSDSQLMVRQIQGSYKVKASNIVPLFKTVKQLIDQLALPYKFTDVRREYNKLADDLANRAMDSAVL